MSPYFVSLIFLFLVHISYKKFKYTKYFVFVPFFDVLINYLSTLGHSDFADLIIDTSPNKLPFIFGLALVMFITIYTFKLLKKTKVISIIKYNQKNNHEN